MAIKFFEVTIRVEVETPDKTIPTVADALDIVKYACENAPYNKDSGVGVNRINADYATEIGDMDTYEVEE